MSFATAQDVYDEESGELVVRLDGLEKTPGGQRRLPGDRLAGAGRRLFTTLIHFPVGPMQGLAEPPIPAAPGLAA